MDIKTWCIPVAACGVLLMTGPTNAARQDAPASYPLPDIKKECTICHLPAGPHKAAELKKNLSSLCLDCHPDRRAPAEHKVDMVPSMAVKGLPLTDGKVTCVTCHDPHRNLHGNLLRMKPRDLCIVCHPR